MTSPAPITGGCRCGAVRYTLAADALPPGYACYCHQCQRWSGSAFSLNCLVPEETLTVTGPVALYEKTTDDRTSVQRVCGVCHARIWNSNSRRPGIAVLRAGTLDRSEELTCVAHIFVAHRQAWLTLPEGAATFEGAPTPEAFEAAAKARR